MEVEIAVEIDYSDDAQTTEVDNAVSTASASDEMVENPSQFVSSAARITSRSRSWQI